MDPSPATHLKLHIEEPPETAGPTLEELAGVRRLCGAFRPATGWSLEYVSSIEGSSPVTAWSCDVPAGDEPSPGRLLLEPDGQNERSAATCAAIEDVQSLAASVGELLGELHVTRQTAWQQAAELATAIPVAGHPDERGHLAKRLEAVLKGGAEAVDCQAAALYLLDDATTELRLRAAWGLPRQRLNAPARPLGNATADVEAVAGHAVVLEDTSLLPHWRCPEDFASAICVPVASPTMILGTLWMFCREPRDFSDQQANLVEIIAGRLAADLDREVLMREGIAARESDRETETVARQQQGQLPQIAPLVEGWQIAGWTEQAESVGGDFHDWFVLPDGALAAAVGNAEGPPLAAAMTAATVTAALKAHSNYRHNTRQMLGRVNETLWESGVGDRFASLMYATIEPESGHTVLAAGGGVGVFVLNGDGWQQVQIEGELLGTDLEAEYKSLRRVLKSGEVLVMVTGGVLRQLSGQTRRRKLDVLGKALHKHRDASAEILVDMARKFCEPRRANGTARDRTVLVVKRS